MGSGWAAGGTGQKGPVEPSARCLFCSHPAGCFAPPAHCLIWSDRFVLGPCRRLPLPPILFWAFLREMFLTTPQWQIHEQADPGRTVESSIRGSFKYETAAAQWAKT